MKKRINLDLDPETMRQILALKQRLRCASVTETIRRAISSTLVATSAKVDGVPVIIP